MTLLSRIEALPRRTQHLLALGLAALGLVLVITSVVLPVARHLDRQTAAIAKAERDRARAETLIASGARWRSRLQEVQADPDRATGFLDGTTGALAAAEAQRRIEDAAATRDARITSVRVLEPVAGDGVEQVRLDIAVTGSLEATSRLLGDLETGAPALFVRRLTMRNPQANSRAASRQEPLLTMTAELAGYRRTTTKEGAE